MELGEMGLKALQVCSPVLVAALTWVATKLAGFIRSKVANEYLQGVLVRLDDAVITVAKDLQQSVVREIKARSADGKLSGRDRDRIKEEAVANLKTYLGPKGLRVLAKVLSLSGAALDNFLDSKVEAAVHDLRTTERAISGFPPPLASVPPPPFTFPPS